MTPAERIRDTIDAMSERYVPRIIIDEQAEQIMEDLTAADYVIVHCPKGERVALDRTGDTDRLIDVEDHRQLAADLASMLASVRSAYADATRNHPDDDVRILHLDASEAVIMRACRELWPSVDSPEGGEQ